MDHIHFLEPGVLRPLLTLAGACFVVWLLVVIYKRMHRPKRTRGSRYPFLGKERLWLFALLSLASMIVAYARPYSDKGISITKSGCIELIVVLDASVSMLATDLGPTRLDVARRELAGLYAKRILNVDCDRVSLFVFDGYPHMRAFYSRDREKFLSDLNAISTAEDIIAGSEAPWYSDLTAALRSVTTAIDIRADFLKKYYPTDPDARASAALRRVLLVVTDGDMGMDTMESSEREQFAAGLAQAIDTLRIHRIRAYGLGVGTSYGVPLLSILSTPSLQGKIDTMIVSRLSDEWQGQRTRLDTRVLDEIASRTGGAVFSLDQKEESAADFLERAISSNRPNTVQIQNGNIDASQELWWFFALLSVSFLLLGILLY
jgi:hypothetical protein